LSIYLIQNYPTFQFAGNYAVKKGFLFYFVKFNFYKYREILKWYKRNQYYTLNCMNKKKETIGKGSKYSKILLFFSVFSGK